jgi:hypothetical protein
MVSQIGALRCVAEAGLWVEAARNIPGSNAALFLFHDLEKGGGSGWMVKAAAK